MSLAERAEGYVARRADGCPFGRLLRGLSDSERVGFDKLLTQVASYTELSTILREEGYSHDRAALIRHMKGKCTCDPE